MDSSNHTSNNGSLKKIDITIRWRKNRDSVIPETFQSKAINNKVILINKRYYSHENNYGQLRNKVDVSIMLILLTFLIQTWLRSQAIKVNQ